MEENMSESDEFQEVEKGYPKKLFTAYGVGFLVILSLFYWGNPLFDRTVARLGFEDAMVFKESVRSSLLFLVIIPAIYIVRVGRGIVREKRYPSTDMKMLRRTKIVRGEKAIVQGRRLTRLGRVAIIFILLSIVATRFLNNKFIENPFGYISSQSWEAATEGEYEKRFYIRWARKYLKDW
jgi:hypothetical protein